jgi:hypothetical protein
MVVRSPEMAVASRAGVYHAHLRRSTTEGAPAERPIVPSARRPLVWRCFRKLIKLC